MGRLTAICRLALNPPSKHSNQGPHLHCQCCQDGLCVNQAGVSQIVEATILWVCVMVVGWGVRVDRVTQRVCEYEEKGCTSVPLLVWCGRQLHGCAARTEAPCFSLCTGRWHTRVSQHVTYCTNATAQHVTVHHKRRYPPGRSVRLP
jgi:hypothetical protein